jgi:HCO3- transporter family
LHRDVSSENNIDFMSFRFWIGIWVMVALLVIVAFDLSALVRYITRFTEESFAVLISLIFIYEAFAKIAEIWSHDVVRTGVTRENSSKSWMYECYCVPPFDKDFAGKKEL